MIYKHAQIHGNILNTFLKNHIDLLFSLTVGIVRYSEKFKKKFAMVTIQYFRCHCITLSFVLNSLVHRILSQAFAI